MRPLSSFGKVCAITGMLVAGSFNTLNLKFEFLTCVPSTTAPEGADGCPPGQRHYNKPWMNTWMMFWAELSMLPVYEVGRCMSDRQRMKLGKKPRARDTTSPFIFAIPGLCDVMCSGLGAVGLMFIPAAVWQMMRGSQVVFTSLFTVVFLKKHLLPYHWVALLITSSGLACVGYAATADDSKPDNGGQHGSNTKALFGICIVLLAQCTGAFQTVFEEHLMHGHKVPAKKTVGLEGLWGVIFQGLLLIAFMYIPGSDNGVIEALPESIVMYTSWPGCSPLIVLTVTYMISIASYNLFGLNITNSISAVTRCLVDSCRTLSVWLVSLILFYSGNEHYGEPWKPHSWLQLVGFIFLVVGTLVYNSVLRLPGFNYRQPEELFPPTAVWSPKLTQYKGIDDYQMSPPCSPVSPGSPVSPTTPALSTPMLRAWEEQGDSTTDGIVMQVETH
eukprot:TRINITY_DN59244_c0_g1_i1.p1 TRINITY_DN59244_c0_g1~~TRINITY_DN59244_c0_g1_i1.p1  ORF type:complete len:467 (-),score=47.17 TRINITY_DN59244_c0_g1_i1:340-1674(-)